MSKDRLYSLSKPLITAKQISSRIKELAKLITSTYPENSQLILVGILKGSFLFLADLMRELPGPIEIDFIQASSYYAGTKSSMEISIIKDLSIPIAGKDVIVIEDIIDSGNTIKKIKAILSSRHPKSIMLCSLLSKPSRRETDVIIDWVGFTIPDIFIVGYGLDVNEKFRNLPYLAEAISTE